MQLPHDLLCQMLGEKDIQIRVLSIQLQAVTAARDALIVAQTKDTHVPAQ